MSPIQPVTDPNEKRPLPDYPGYASSQEGETNSGSDCPICIGEETGEASLEDGSYEDIDNKDNDKYKHSSDPKNAAGSDGQGEAQTIQAQKPDSTISEVIGLNMETIKYELSKSQSN